MNVWLQRPHSLVARTMLLFALIACAVIVALGAYFYDSARTSMEARADLQLIGRVTHFRRLARSVYSLS